MVEQASGHLGASSALWSAGRAAFAVGNFFAEPDPSLDLRQAGRLWHAGKVLFERSWLGKPLERRLARAGLIVGGRLAGFRVAL